MNEKELRIGNWIEYKGSHCAWAVSDFAEIEHGILNFVRPIPLTEEWLVKFGFVFDGVRYQQYINNNLWAFVKNNAYGWYSPFIEISNGIKYVHQLQNLYFTLTGEELKDNFQERLIEGDWVDLSEDDSGSLGVDTNESPATLVSELPEEPESQWEWSPDPQPEPPKEQIEKPVFPKNRS